MVDWHKKGAKSRLSRAQQTNALCCPYRPNDQGQLTQATRREQADLIHSLREVDTGDAAEAVAETVAEAERVVRADTQLDAQETSHKIVSQSVTIAQVIITLFK